MDLQFRLQTTCCCSTYSKVMEMAKLPLTCCREYDRLHVYVHSRGSLKTCLQQFSQLDLLLLLGGFQKPFQAQVCQISLGHQEDRPAVLQSTDTPWSCIVVRPAKAKEQCTNVVPSSYRVICSCGSLRSPIFDVLNLVTGLAGIGVNNEQAAVEHGTNLNFGSSFTIPCQRRLTLPKSVEC